MNYIKGNPTTLTYTSLNTAYDYLNRELFSGILPPCLITIQRHTGAYGFFSGERFANTADPADVADEIALNPVHFATRKPTDILSTLAHEMTHLWQHHYGRRPRKSYHDKQWAQQFSLCQQLRLIFRCCTSLTHSVRPIFRVLSDHNRKGSAPTFATKRQNEDCWCRLIRSSPPCRARRRCRPSASR